MSFPFSVTLKKNFKEVSKVDVKETITKETQEKYILLVRKKIEELVLEGTFIPNGIYENIIINSHFYNRTNLYLLFLAYMMYFDNQFRYRAEFLQYKTYVIKKNYPDIDDNKLDYELNVYLTLINNVHNNNTLYVKL